MDYDCVIFRIAILFVVLDGSWVVVFLKCTCGQIFGERLAWCVGPDSQNTVFSWDILWNCSLVCVEMDLCCSARYLSPLILLLCYYQIRTVADSL